MGSWLPASLQPSRVHAPACSHALTLTAQLQLEAAGRGGGGRRSSEHLQARRRQRCIPLISEGCLKGKGTRTAKIKRLQTVRSLALNKTIWGRLAFHLPRKPPGFCASSLQMGSSSQTTELVLTSPHACLASPPAPAGPAEMLCWNPAQ